MEHSLVISKNIYFLIFIDFEREREHTYMSRGGTEREKPKQVLHYQHSAQCRAWSHKPWDHDLNWNQESDAQLTEPLRCSFSKNLKHEGRLGGSVSWAYDFGSGHDLTVGGFEPRFGLCAGSSEPGACFRFCVSLSLCPSPPHTVSICLLKINKCYFLNLKHEFIPRWEKWKTCPHKYLHMNVYSSFWQNNKKCRDW